MYACTPLPSLTGSETETSKKGDSSEGDGGVGELLCFAIIPVCAVFCVWVCVVILMFRWVCFWWGLRVCVRFVCGLVCVLLVCVCFVVASWVWLLYSTCYLLVCAVVGVFVRGMVVFVLCRWLCGLCFPLVM